MDIYDTNTLIGLVESLIRPQSFLLDNFFPGVVNETSEAISWDVKIGKRRVTPFVSPLRAGKVVEGQGYKTDTFKPAYTKDKRALDPLKPLRRAAGEQIGGGNISPAVREAANLANEMQDQVEMLTRRKELMAAEALRTGKLIVTGDGFASVEVDFGRDAGLTVALTTTARWGETDVSPSADIEAWSTTMLQKSGVAPSVLVFTPEAWDLFKADTEIKDAIETRRGGVSTIELGLQVELGAVFKGNWGSYSLYVYNDWYVDDADVEQRMLAAHTVLLLTPAMEGTQYHGAIIDPEADYGAHEFFIKSWIEKDPAQRLLLMQSAPLVVPTRVNASFCATVR